MTPSKLIHGTDFHLFKEGIEPKWEDPKCARGGKWTFTAPKTSNRGSLDTYWLNTVRAAARRRALAACAHALLGLALGREPSARRAPRRHPVAPRHATRPRRARRAAPRITAPRASSPRSAHQP